MILEWILIAWIAKRLLDSVVLREMTREEYRRILERRDVPMRRPD